MSVRTYRISHAGYRMVLILNRRLGNVYLANNKRIEAVKTNSSKGQGEELGGNLIAKDVLRLRLTADRK